MQNDLASRSRRTYSYCTQLPLQSQLLGEVQSLHLSTYRHAGILQAPFSQFLFNLYINDLSTNPFSHMVLLMMARPLLLLTTVLNILR